MKLSYKAWHPVEILEGLEVKTSVLDKRDRGLSMTTNLEESGHGPFMFVFREHCPWYEQFTQCEYGVRPEDRRPDVNHCIYKNECFRVEQEWWSPTSVKFQIEDVEQIIFMADSPATRVHPKISKRELKRLIAKFPNVNVVIDNQRYPKE